MLPDKNRENKDNPDDMAAESDDEILEFAETLPFTVESLEDLEVEAINANAPDVTIMTAEKKTSSSTIKTHTQELADYLMRSVNDLHALEVRKYDLTVETKALSLLEHTSVPRHEMKKINKQR